MRTFVFIDAANLFYGGEKSLGWTVDYQKLYKYLEKRYDASRVYYFAGIEIYDYPFDYQFNDWVCINKLEKYSEKGNRKLIHLYKKLEKFRYILRLKPVKKHTKADGTIDRKANCDVGITLCMMQDKDDYERLVLFSGDGDFISVLKYLTEKEGKQLVVVSRAIKTAKEIRQIAGIGFVTFESLRPDIEKEENKKPHNV